MTENLAADILSKITTYMKYAKYMPELKRRENWEELVTRNKMMHIRKFPELRKEIESAYKFVYEKKVLPSMRSMQFAGRPIEVNNTRIYNCSYGPADDWRAFSEFMFLLLSGTGVGFSVQRHHVEKLPPVKGVNKKTNRRYLVGDSIEGWSDAVKVLMKSYFEGRAEVKFDFSDIREKGAPLLTSGGKAPGPEPLKQCLNQIKLTMDQIEPGAQLTPIQVHDIVCHIADAVLAGGIRRAALISIFSADDDEMIAAKGNFKVIDWKQAYGEGPLNEVGEPTVVEQIHETQDGKKFYDIDVEVEQPGYANFKGTMTWVSEDLLTQIKEEGTIPWYMVQPQRGRANNSASLLRHRITKDFFMELWKKVEDSGSGEPGIYLSNNADWGTNPCAEIALRPNQMCNLTEINASDMETQEEFNARAKAASFIGTLQATYTDFHYLRMVWKKTVEKDALIGVGMTGIGSGKVLNLDMEEAGRIVNEENVRAAKLFGINRAARTTTVKPSGTSSIVLGTSSGVHAWHSEYYIRRVRVGKNEAIYRYLAENHPSLVEDDHFRPHDTAVIGVPQKAPEGAILRHESAIEMLERVKKINMEWVRAAHVTGDNTHNVSATVSIKPEEWKEVGEWMWENRDTYNGLSVLPYDGGTYIQAPFEDTDKETYEKLMKTLTSIDLDQVIEEEDNTDLQGELACAGGACEVT